MIESILEHLPEDVRDDLATRTDMHLNSGFLRLRPAAELDDRLDDLLDLGTMSNDEVLASLARWTAYASYLGELVTFTSILVKRLEHFIRLRNAHLRATVGAAGGVTNAGLTSAAITDERMHALDEARQSLSEVRAVLEQRERACRTAAEAASRAVTARQTEIQRLRLEARRA